MISFIARFFADNHGLSMHEDNDLPNLAAEILVAEQVDAHSALSTEIAYVSQEGPSVDSKYRCIPF